MAGKDVKFLSLSLPDGRLACAQEICGEAAQKWSLKKVAMAHRTGLVGIGHPSVIIAASSAHRADALEVSLLCSP